VTLAQHLLAVALVLIDIAVRGLRIRQLLPVSLGRAMAINTSGDALAAISPARMGGEPVRFLGFRRAGASAGAVLAAFATEVGVDIIVLGGMAAAVGAWAARGGAWAAFRSAHGLGLASLALVLLLALACLALLWRARHLKDRLVATLRDAWDAMRSRSWSTLGAVAGLTVVSVAARTAILPVLLVGVPGVSWGPVIPGSFALVFGQGVLPIPGGLGAVDLGFALGFSSLLKGAALARLLIVWRFYSLVLGALAGAVLLVWAAWARVRERLVESRPVVPTPLLDTTD